MFAASTHHTGLLTKLGMGVLGAALLLIGACDNTTQPAASAAADAPRSVPAIAAKGKDRYVLGIVAKSSSNPVYLAARAGAEAEAREIAAEDGVQIEIVWRSPLEEDSARQSEIISELVAAGVDGIAVSCTDPLVATPAIDRAVAAGVEVVTFDSDAPDSRRCGFYGIDDAAAGSALFAKLAEALGEQGRVAVLAGNRTAENITQRVIGAAMEARKHEGMEIVGVFGHEETPAAARAEMMHAQEEHEPINGWVLVGGWPLYDPAPIESLPDDVKIISMDPLPPALDHAAAGRVHGFVAQPYFGWGAESVRMLYTRLHTGQAPTPTVQRAEVQLITPDQAEAYRQQWVGWVGRPTIPNGTASDG